jgi:hypothetical protein
MDLTVLAYATLALSLFVSAIKMGGWILNADPRAILNAGRWALAAFAALALGVLIWLMATGRWTSAMMLAAFMLPVFVQAAPRWRVLFGPLNAMRGGFPPGAPDRGAGFSVHNGSPPHNPADPELVRQSIAVLQAYLAQSGRQIEHKPIDTHIASGATRGNGNGRVRMSLEEALDVLGLDPTATPQEIREAHRRLEQKVVPERGGTHYLVTKINEARDVLLGE